LHIKGLDEPTFGLSAAAIVKVHHYLSLLHYNELPKRSPLIPLPQPLPSNTMTTSENAKTQFVTVNEVKYAYRLLGPPTTSTPTPPLLLLQFFRASIDHWDPLLLSLLSAHRPLILFDSAGVGHSTGTIPDSISGMAEHTSTFLEAIGVKEVDILGFSMGGMVAQQLALDASTGKAKGLIIRKMILSATSPGRGPSGGEGVVDGDGKEINERAGTPETSLENFLKLFFLDSESSREAGREWYARIMKRTRESSGEERAREVQGMGIMMQGMSMGKWAGGEGMSDCYSMTSSTAAKWRREGT
jgi:pimeloyl-ACP methyl ester carboxylesterase